MKIPILLLSIASFSFAVQTTSLENSKQYYYPEKDLTIEVFNKGKVPACLAPLFNQPIYGFFRVEKAERMEIYEYPDPKSPINSYANKGDFLEVESVNAFGWAKFKNAGWGRGYLLYPPILVSQPKTQEQKVVAAKPSSLAETKDTGTDWYRLDSSSLRIYEIDSPKAKSFPSGYVRGDVFEVDTSTKHGWVHIKDRGWAKAFKLNKKREGKK